MCLQHRMWSVASLKAHMTNDCQTKVVATSDALLSFTESMTTILVSTGKVLELG